MRQADIEEVACGDGIVRSAAGLVFEFKQPFQEFYFIVARQGGGGAELYPIVKLLAEGSINSVSIPTGCGDTLKNLKRRLPLPFL